ncbi:MAG: DUF3019 domain-containing protein [Pseudomonadota bacterium]
MLRLLFLALLFLCLAPQAVGDDEVKLTVKPVLCILDEQTTECDMAFLVLWESSVDGYYCLYNHFGSSPLRCWQSENEGQHEERRIVERSFQYWLTVDGDDEPVATAAVDVMIAAPADRRRSRRTRHIWDLN